MTTFFSLHTMTEYSFMESSIRIDSLISLAKKKDQKHLAITDHNNLFGVFEFVEKCKKNNIKPIIGVDLDVENYRLILLAKNYDGYKHISKLVSKKGRNEEIKLNEIENKDIIIIDHPEFGFYKNNKQELSLLNYFIATNDNIKKSVKLNFSRKLEDDDSEAIKLIDMLNDKKPYRADSVVLKHDKNDPSVIRAFEIASLCSVEFPKIENPLPKFSPGNDSMEILKNELKTNISNLFNKNINSEYLERLNYEVSIIEKLKFADYFLIIADLVKWSKGNGILIGPGRGSSAGSLVSYILGITEIDPIKYGLLFERFLNPERVSMPDIDIDIQDNRRNEVIDYLFSKYGYQKVAFISTFQRLAAKSSIRDVARLMKLPTGDINELSKLIPNNMTLDESYEQSSRFRAAINKSDINQKIFNLSKMIEGLPRQMGTHAAGIVISKNNIEDIVPTIISGDGHNQVQSSMDYIEKYGLLKIDLLGLRNLTIIQNIQKEIYKNFNKKVDLKKISLDDKITNDLLSSGEVNGIFQLESHGMKKTLKNIRVDSFGDLVAILSLFRPGPMEYIDVYAKRKHGKEPIEKISPKYDEILESTYGIIVYQEQIMFISQTFAGMSFGSADILRRAISKKNIEQISSLKKEFIDGSISNGHNKDDAEKIFKMIERFADYGFNKSHAVAYASLSYRMAFLKARFPFEFYTSLLNSSIGSIPMLKTYVLESKSKGIKVVAPNINYSDFFVFNKNKKIVLPLSIIKGLGQSASEKIINLRREKPFEDFFDIVSRLRFVGISESIITSLIKGNALRDFGHMKSLLDSLPQAIRYSEMITITKNGEKKLEYSILPKPKLVNSEREYIFESNSEKEIYSFNLNSFETSKYEKDGARLIDIKENRYMTVPVYIEYIKKITDKNGKEMAIITLHDSSLSIEFFVFQDLYKSISNQKRGKVVLADLSYNIRNGEKLWYLKSPWKDIDE